MTTRNIKEGSVVWQKEEGAVLVENWGTSVCLQQENDQVLISISDVEKVIREMRRVAKLEVE